MNKTDLRTKWSKYCNTDKLVDDMMELLTDLGHRNSEHGVCVVLDKYFTAKEPLIKLFMTSNRYIGNMRIAMVKEFDRDIDQYAINDFVYGFSKAIGATNMLLKYEDENGKTFSDYIKTGSRKVKIAKFIKDKDTKARAKIISNFDPNTCATSESAAKLNAFNSSMEFFRRFYLSTIYSNQDLYGVDIKKGMKTSRAFNKVCVHYGIDKADNYNKLFAQYADLVSNNTRKLHFVISLNPLDYLTMSIGKSWTSCHSTKSLNRNGVANMACGGCVSYMLDNVSIITYVVDKLDEQVHKEGKIYRQMYYYNDNLFIQSRLYPQGNDGATDLYAKFKSFMQEEFTELLNVGDEWVELVGGKYAAQYSSNQGFHYVDANSHSSCGIFYPKEKENNLKNMMIGSMSYCFYCGEPQGSRSRLSHPDCIY